MEKIMNGIISVIIPVYNVQKYLKESIESVLNQSYSKLQIILIDDGSTDSSSEICDKYAEKDKRITVIHQKNGGAAHAKNAGLRIATGKYLAFVDSDDYLEPGAYKYMMEQMEQYQADIVQGCFCNVFKNQVEEQILFDQKQEYRCVEYLELFTKDWTCGLLWDKLYRRELFEGIFFEEGHKIDDEFFTYQGVMNAKKIVRVPKVVYNYRKRLSGVMLSKESQKKLVLDKLDYLSVRRKKVEDKFPELKKSFDEHYLNMLLILAKDFSGSEESVQRIKNLLKDYFAETQRIHISFGLKRRLIELKYKPIKKIIKEKTMLRTQCDFSSYFE